MPINIFRTKTVILGDPGVGKTAVVQMYISDGREFPKNYNMTLGTELHAKRCQSPSSQDAVEMIIYDCGGLDLYVDCLSQFWDQPELLMLMYDVCAPASLQSVSDWYRVAVAAEWAGARPKPLAGLLFANKTDLTQRRLVTTETGSQLAIKLGLHYLEGSAKENKGIVESFDWLAQQLQSEYSRPRPVLKPSYSSMHKTSFRSSISNTSLK